MTKSVPSYFTALFTVSIIRSQKVYTVKVLFFFLLGGKNLVKMISPGVMTPKQIKSNAFN